MVARFWLSLFVVGGLVACGTEGPVGGGSSGSGGGTVSPTGGSDTALDGTAAGPASSDGLDGTTASPPQACDCAPGTDLIHVISDDGVLSSYDPVTHAFAEIGEVPCGGFAPYSMAVDREGMAWVLLLDNIPHATVAKGLFRVDVATASVCEPVPYAEGLFGAFGTSFVTNSAVDNCERLYAQSYSGSGPFSEGPDAGNLGVLTDEGVLESLGTIDFDGGELAGTGDGRLFSFTGVEPAQIIEFDKSTAEPLTSLPLDGFSKTNASAMAFWGGDFYLFTESGNPECIPCLERSCTDELTACEADPACEPVLQCLLAGGGEGPECTGDIEGPGGPLRDCLFESCIDACGPSGVVSRVTHVDWDESDGPGRMQTVVVDPAPMRVVGAGSSTCAPVAVP